MDGIYPLYDWEKIIVTTRDDYELSMYHIYNDTARLAADGSKGPIMWMHGGGEDPKEALFQQRGARDPTFGQLNNTYEKSNGESPLIQMADLGHDIYMPSNRGNPDSLGHTSLNYESDLEYWDYTLTELGNDIVDFAQSMFSSAETGKGYLFAYSNGAGQALVALALQKSEMTTYFNRVVLLATCTNQEFEPYVTDFTFSTSPGIYEPVLGVGINNIGGLGWDDKRETICDQLS